MRSYAKQPTQAPLPQYNHGNNALAQNGNGVGMQGAINMPPLQATPPLSRPAQQPPTQQQSHYNNHVNTQQPLPQTPQQKVTSYFRMLWQRKMSQAFNAEQLNTQIARIDGKNKILDFSDGLIRADPKDYANLHGTGGQNSAPNSVIRLALTDYSQGAGKSTYVTANMDVYQIERLLAAVKMASCGMLGIGNQLDAVKAAATANGQLTGWLQSGHCPTYQELANLQQMLGQGLNSKEADAPAWKMPTILKANPYGKKEINGVKHAPVSSLDVQYFPAKNYSWTIRIVNFLAPLNERQNGSINFDGKGAVEKKEAVISVTTADLMTELLRVDHFIWNWEAQLTKQTALMHEEKENRREAAKRAKGNH